jgi:hypothetical protein
MKTATSPLSSVTRVGILLILALVMLATRTNHFSALPDASWALFFVAGFYLSSADPSATARTSLRGLLDSSARWAFPLLMALAVLIDFFVITGQGMDFWSHYCVSVAYWFLVPSYAAMWLGGSLLRKYHTGLHVRELGLLIVCVVAATSVCYLISNGSFYWLSPSWINANAPVRSFSGWITNLGDWYLPYLRTSLMYVGVATMLHVATLLAANSLAGNGRATPVHKR